MKDICVLMFHDIMEDGQRSKSVYALTRSELRNILGCVKASGRRPLRASELSNSDAPTVGITFDDGLKSTASIALPVLEELGIPATVFVPTGRIGRPGRMSEEDLRLWLITGHEIGCHGRKHVGFTTISSVETKTELTGSRNDLKDLLGIEAQAMSFPGGSEDVVHQEFAFSAGFRVLFTSKPDYSARADKVINRFAIRSGAKLETINRLLMRNDASSFRYQKLVYHLHKALGTKHYQMLRNVFLRLKGLE